ncbi:MAG TPA: FG-GAP-like repeat-containing protein [Desulfobacterales bacterium]
MKHIFRTTQIPTRIRQVLLAAILAILLAPAGSAAQSEDAPARIAVIPFSVNGPAEFGYLRAGTWDMLSTRLAVPDETVIVDRAKVEAALAGVSTPIGPEQARQLAAELGAEYVLFGSLTLLGSNISTDGRLYDAAADKTVLTFNRTGNDPGAVIEHIDTLSAEIKTQVFGLQTAVASQPTPQPQSTVPPSRQHPDKLITGPQSGAGVGIIQTERQPPPMAASRSRRFNAKIIGVAAADMDGDGAVEVAFVSEKEVEVLRMAEGLFQRLGRMDLEGRKPVSIDAVDANGNGKAEIFVTALDRQGQSLDSLVLEWNGDIFVTLAEKQKWYFGAVRLPDRGRVLIGQERGKREIFAGGVFELMPSGDGYIAGAPLPLPVGVNIYGFDFGDVFNDGRNLLAAYTDKDKIRIYNDAGVELYTSAETFGGNPAFLEHIEFLKQGGNPNLEPRVAPRTYLPQRLFVSDLEGDGKTDIITAVNKEIAGRLLERLRLFDEGRLECLAWSGSGLFTRWKTHSFSGYVSDITLADFDGDGQPEVVIAVVAESGSMVMTEPKSLLYTLDPGQIAAGS